MELKKYITARSIFFINKTDKVSVLAELCAQSIALGHVSDPAEFKQAVLERESLMSTGIGLGVAIPHAKLSCIDDFFIATGLLANPVEWDSLDHKPVRIAFLIGGPQDSQGAYLRLLSQLMFVIKNDEKLMKLKAAQSAEDVIGLIG